MSFHQQKPMVVVREVWAENLEAEFSLIRKSVSDYPFAAMDTEFPGVIYRAVDKHRLPSTNYGVMKANVDALRLIQVGLTLSDAQGNLPHFGTASSYIWEFNFFFDIGIELHNPDSIQLLERQGIDFKKHKEKGVCSWKFASLFCQLLGASSLTWVTFHSAYDFGFLIKNLTIQSDLPDDLEEFMTMVRYYFGESIYDMKHVMRFCDGLYGGLERVARTLEVDRVTGKCHQAGSDSLLTLQTFMKLKHIFFGGNLDRFQGILFGLEIVC